MDGTVQNNVAPRTTTPGTRNVSFIKRLAWFVALWVASVCALGIVAIAIRLMIRA